MTYEEKRMIDRFLLSLCLNPEEVPHARFAIIAETVWETLQNECKLHGLKIDKAKSNFLTAHIYQHICDANLEEV